MKMNVGYSVSVDGGPAITVNREISSFDGIINEEIAVPVGSNLHALLNVDVSALKGMALFCGRDMDVYTNDLSGGTPDQHFALKAGKPLVWDYQSGVTNPFTVDITDIYITLAAGASATLKIKGIQDITP